MAFVSKDWRDPGGIYVKSEVGRWMSTKTCRLRIFEMLNERYLKRAYCQSLSEYENENDKTQIINEVFKETPSGFYQPHIKMKSISTKESVMVTSLIETLLALDFKVAIRDIRRIGYVCRVLHIFIKELFSNLSGQIQIYIMDLLKEVLQEVLNSKNYVNVVRMLLFQLQTTLENNKYNHVGSFHLWCNHLRCLEEMQLSLSKITFNEIPQTNDFKFQNLPIECILKVLQHLTSPHDFEMLGQTCLTLQCLVNDKVLWQSLVKHHFSEIQISSVVSKISINASDKTAWFFIYTRLLNKFGDSHFFPTKLAKCNSCSSIFWPNEYAYSFDVISYLQFFKRIIWNLYKSKRETAKSSNITSTIKVPYETLTDKKAFALSYREEISEFNAPNNFCQR